MLELASPNRALLRHVINTTGLGDAIHLHDLAASNQSETLSLMPTFAGDERAKMRRSPNERRCKGRCTETVRAVALDDFFDSVGLRSVSHVSIDVEGAEPLVLQGLRASVAARRVALLEFEVNRRGYWGTGAEAVLEHTLRWLSDNRYGCVFLAHTDLLPASGSCWLPAFEKRKWSNMLCAHEAPVLAALSKIAAEGYRRRSAVAQGLALGAAALGADGGGPIFSCLGQDSDSKV